MAVLCRGVGIDLFLGNQENHVVAAVAQGFGDGNAGKQVAAGATAGDEDVKSLRHVGRRVRQRWEAGGKSR